MARNVLGIIVFLLCVLSLHAQKKNDPYKSTDKIIAKIPDSLTATTDEIAGFINQNFSDERDKVRAVYMWVAGNISYDVEALKGLQNIKKDTIRAIDILKSRKGVCEHYAVLFAEIANKTGLKTYVVSGYTKQHSKVDSIGHAWCATLVDSAWYLFDPTWGAGGLLNGKYVKNLNTKYFRINPAVMIKDHMPFDPMWQMLSYTISNSEFTLGLSRAISEKNFFSFADSLAVAESQTEIERIISEERRVAANQLINPLLKRYDEYLKKRINVYFSNIEVAKHNAVVDKYNNAVELTRNCVSSYNEFIDFKNNQFRPSRTDNEIREMIMLPYRLHNEAFMLVSELSAKDKTLNNQIKQINKELEDLGEAIDEQKKFVEEYLAASKIKRPTMFYKIKMK